MNDQSQMMNPPPPAVMMHHGPMMSQASQVIVSQSQLLSGSQVMSQPRLLGQSQVLNQQHAQLIGQPQMLSQLQVPMLNRTFKPWPPLDSSVKFHGSGKPVFGPSMPGRSNWKSKNMNDKRQGPRNVQNSLNAAPSGSAAMGGYKPPTLHELQFQNRLQARKFYPKKKFSNRFAPYAPRNTTSYIIRAKKSGGIASLASPCPVTPSVLPTPVFSPSREVLGDMAKEEWGVDGYGSMKGLIRLRGEFDNKENEDDGDEDDNEEDNNGSGESDVEEGDNSVLSRLDHEMSRFEMVCPSYGFDYNNMLENRVHDQDAHITHLEEENLTLRESLFLMEREMEDLKRRLQILEGQNHVSEDVNEEVVENGSENESAGCSDAHGTFGETKDESAGCAETDSDRGQDDEAAENEGVRDTYMQEKVVDATLEAEDRKNVPVQDELSPGDLNMEKRKHGVEDDNNSMRVEGVSQ